MYSIPWEPITFIFRGYSAYIGGLKPSFFMVLGSKRSYLCTIYNNHSKEKKHPPKSLVGFCFAPFSEPSGSLPAILRNPVEGYNDWTTFFELADPSSLVRESDQPPP